MALSPIVQTRDGAYHSVIPFACYMRSLGTGAWGWLRDGSEGHWGPLTFETDLSASPLFTVADILPVQDVRVQGYLDVLEDRLLMDNPRTDYLSWLYCGWQHQVGIQKNMDAYLIGNDIPVYLRSFLNGYAVNIRPDKGYEFNEHVFAGPPDKIFEDGAFVVRMRNMLVTEDGDDLWLAKAVPLSWFEQDQKITVNNAPTWYGDVSYNIVSDINNDRICAMIDMPIRNVPGKVLIRIANPKSLPIKSVSVNNQPWNDFNSEMEYVSLHDLSGKVNVECRF
jgi:hypothetical protein